MELSSTTVYISHNICKVKKQKNSTEKLIGRKQAFHNIWTLAFRSIAIKVQKASWA